MITPEQYNELKEVIQKANPEIMELKFGCEFELLGNIHKIISIAGDEGEWYELLSIRQPYTDVAGVPKKISREEFTYLKTLNVLGRPIRLADVLLAIDKNPLYTKENSYFIDSNGNFHEWFTPKGRLDLRTVANWNLHNDSLDYHYEHQPETIEFLYNLLVTK